LNWIIFLFCLDRYHVIDVIHGIKKESKVLADKLDKNSIKKKKKKKKKKNTIVNFYWNRDMKGKSVKTKDLQENVN